MNKVVVNDKGMVVDEVLVVGGEGDGGEGGGWMLMWYSW